VIRTVSYTEEDDVMDKPNDPSSYLVVSEDENPKVQLQTGMKFQVVTLRVVDETLKNPGKVAARLCGGTNTCLALIDPDPK
jgi:hypothetical protein